MPHIADRAAGTVVDAKSSPSTRSRIAVSSVARLSTRSRFTPGPRTSRHLRGIAAGEACQSPNSMEPKVEEARIESLALGSTG